MAELLPPEEAAKLQEQIEALRKDLQESITSEQWDDCEQITGLFEGLDIKSIMLMVQWSEADQNMQSAAVAIPFDQFPKLMRLIDKAT